MKTAELIYCYDPMCSWCWGFRPAWDELQTAIAPMIESGELSVRPLLGGLAVDSDEPMPKEMQEMLEATWKRITASLGTEFNHDFWRNCQPRRSTYPACRACLVARDEGLEAEMYAQIQRAYYAQAKNPSDLDTLADCAEQIGISRDVFIAAMAETKASGRLEQEIKQARQMGLNSFPSFALVVGEQIIPIELDYSNPNNMLTRIKQILAAAC